MGMYEELQDLRSAHLALKNAVDDAIVIAYSTAGFSVSDLAEMTGYSSAAVTSLLKAREAVGLDSAAKQALDIQQVMEASSLLSEHSDQLASWYDELPERLKAFTIIWNPAWMKKAFPEIDAVTAREVVDAIYPKKAAKRRAAARRKKQRAKAAQTSSTPSVSSPEEPVSAESSSENVRPNAFDVSRHRQEMHSSDDHHEEFHFG